MVSISLPCRSFTSIECSLPATVLSHSYKIQHPKDRLAESSPKIVFFFFLILRRIGKNKAQAHHTSTFSCRVSIRPIAPDVFFCPTTVFFLLVRIGTPSSSGLRVSRTVRIVPSMASRAWYRIALAYPWAIYCFPPVNPCRTALPFRRQIKFVLIHLFLHSVVVQRLLR